VSYRPLIGSCAALPGNAGCGERLRAGMVMPSLENRMHPILAARLAPVCVAVTAPTAVELFAQAWQALNESRFIELRLDAVDDPEAAIALLGEFCAEHAGAAVLATCRRVGGGGGFRGSVEEQLLLLSRCAQAGAVLVDVELETLGAVPPSRLTQLAGELEAAGTLLLVSAHDFVKTDDPDGTFEQLRTLGAPAHPAMYKVVTTARELCDNLKMLKMLERVSQEVPVVGICMGEAGLPSRVLAASRGAAFTFAASAGGVATAAGQVTAAALLRNYRAAELSERTRVYGVAGNPVTHSLSPALHNAVFEAERTDAVYLPLHTTSVDDLVRFVDELPVDGLSVTMPWKVALLPRLAAMDARTRRIGAVNTIARREDGQLTGTNTDAPAIVEPLARALQAEGLPVQGTRVLVLGAGGAARAAVVALAEAGADVWIANRTEARAAALAAECGARVADEAAMGRALVVVNATPAGMAGFEAAAAVDLERLDPQRVRVVFEMVYRPAETALIRWARGHGIRVIDGLTMFAGQAAGQWAFWHGVPEASERVVGTMQEALRKALAAS
jgi:3-dehydroquinate dehydratase/shikimate dehydrogenase